MNSILKNFKPIPGWDGYFASKNGEILSRRYNNYNYPKIRKQTKTKQGYMCITMINGGKVFLKRVHRLIAETYLKKDRDRPFVNHKNGIKDDNRIENLEWVSRHENDIHKNRVLGLVVRHKLTAAKTIEIYNLKDSGRSQESVAVQYGISRRMVGMIWRHERGAMVTINAPNKNSL